MTHDGLHDKELARRVGMAKADMKSLEKVWRHTSLPRQRKLEIYIAVVETRLLYGLASTWLNAAQRRSLSGFQNRCLRSAMGIKCSYVSRVSNADVLQVSGHIAADQLLLERQLRMFGKVARAPAGSPLQLPSFIPGTLWPATEGYVRRVGRPRREWIQQVSENARRLFGSDLEGLVTDKGAWSMAVRAKMRGTA